MMLYICIKFHESIFSELLRGLVFRNSGFSKGHNSVKNLGKVMVLVLCTSSDDAFYNFI